MEKEPISTQTPPETQQQIAPIVELDAPTDVVLGELPEPDAQAQVDTSDGLATDITDQLAGPEASEATSRTRRIAKWAGGAALAVAAYKVMGNALGGGQEAAGAAFLGLRAKRNLRSSDRAADKAADLLDTAAEVQAMQGTRQDSADAIIDSITYKTPSTALEDFRKTHRPSPRKTPPVVPPMGTERQIPLHDAVKLSFTANENSQAKQQFRDTVRNFGHVILDDHGHVVDERTLKSRLASGHFTKEQARHIQGVRERAQTLYDEIHHTEQALDKASRGSDSKGVKAREKEAKLVERADLQIDKAIDRADRAADLLARKRSRP